MKHSTVLCYSGYTYAQEPRVVIWQGQRCRVARVERRWRTQKGPAFRVETEEGETFDLLYGEDDHAWQVLLLKDSDAGSLPS